MMPAMRLSLFATMCALVLFEPSFAEKPKGYCLGPLRQALLKADFPGADCEKVITKIKYLGKLHYKKIIYLIYYYYYEDDPRFLNGTQRHALGRLLIFKNNTNHYIGEYPMDAGFKAALAHNRIYITTDVPRDDGVIEMGPNGPPKTAYFGGEFEDLQP